MMKYQEFKTNINDANFLPFSGVSKITIRDLSKISVKNHIRVRGVMSLATKVDMNSDLTHTFPHGFSCETLEFARGLVSTILNSTGLIGPSFKFLELNVFLFFMPLHAARDIIKSHDECLRVYCKTDLSNSDKDLKGTGLKCLPVAKSNTPRELYWTIVSRK